MHKQSKLQGQATYTSLQYYEWYTDGQQAVKRYLNTGKSTKITYRVTDEGNLSSFHNTAFFHAQLIESHVIVANRMPKGKKKKIRCFILCPYAVLLLSMIRSYKWLLLWLSNIQIDPRFLTSVALKIPLPEVTTHLNTLGQQWPCPSHITCLLSSLLETWSPVNTNCTANSPVRSSQRGRKISAQNMRDHWTRR